MLGYLILILIIVFAAVIAVRTIRFTPKPQPPISEETFSFDRDRAVYPLMLRDG